MPWRAAIPSLSAPNVRRRRHERTAQSTCRRDDRPRHHDSRSERAAARVDIAQKIDTIAGNNSELNTAALDGCPIQSPDGLEPVHRVEPPGGRGGLDIWMATRASANAQWGAHADLGEPVNSAADDFCPTPVGNACASSSSAVKRCHGACGQGGSRARAARADPLAPVARRRPRYRRARSHRPPVAHPGVALAVAAKRPGSTRAWTKAPAHSPASCAVRKGG